MFSDLDYKYFFESVPGLYLIILPNFDIVNASDSYLEATMTKRADITGKNLFDVFPDNPDDVSANGELNLRYSLNHVLKNKTAHTMAVQKYDIRQPDGTFIEKFWSPLNKPVLNSNNEVVYIIHRVEDVTAYLQFEKKQLEKDKETETLSEHLKQMEWDILKRSKEIHELNSHLELKVNEKVEALIKSEKKFKTAMDNMLEGIQIISPDWRYLYINEAAAKQGQSTKEALIGYTMMEKYPGIENSDAFRLFEKCLAENNSYVLINEFTHVDGSKGWFELSIQPCEEGLFILSIDISERKKAESEILKLNSELEQKVTERTKQLEVINKELESFSYSVSHDLRAPLRSINGFTQILLDKYSSQFDDEGKRFMSIIINNAKKMGQLIDDLLAFSRFGKQNLTRTTLDMNSMISNIALELKNEITDKEIEIDIKPLENILGDSEMMKQVVLNLVSNALKYSSKQEKIKIEIGSYIEDNYTTFYFTDNGVGFDMLYYDKLFGVFQRLHNANDFDGTGVGLSIAQRIINKHDGKIWAKSAVNEGATFYFSLPR
jgi:PAS domain S-box-containing protein